MPTGIELRGIDASYGEGQVLDSVSLCAEAGCVTALLGPNGAGKTTALRVASGLLAPDAGSIFVGDDNVTSSSARQRARSGICLIPEGRGIFPDLTVSDNLRLHSYLSLMTPSQREEKVFTTFPRLSKRRRQQAGTLSGGEQQMLALSRALTTDPKILLIDELSMGLAPNLVEELMEHVVQLATEGRAVLLVEQLAEFALEIASHACVLVRGRVVASGGPEDVRESLFGAYLGEETRNP